jgi:hypothetical protein
VTPVELQGGIVIIVPPLVSFFALDTVSLLAPVVHLDVCVSIVYNITHVTFVLIPATLFGRCDAAGRVPTWTLAVVEILTPPPVRVI